MEEAESCYRRQVLEEGSRDPPVGGTGLLYVSRIILSIISYNAWVVFPHKKRISMTTIMELLLAGNTGNE